jgi:tetratricopeptide (TPR) repeat protein
MSYHARLAFAKRWVRSKKPPFRDVAIAILDQLRNDYPHVLEIEDELALAYLEADRPSEFEGVLSIVMSRYGQLSEEFLCRIGRFWKDRGDKVRATDRSDALSCFEKALDWYRKGYAIRANYYPGINVAGLQFILGKTEPARQSAEAVLQSLEGSAPPEELSWIRATQADARLLLENHPEAEALYRQAARLSDPQGRSSMRRQVELLAAYAPPASTMKPYWTEDKLDEIFGP